MRERIRDRLLLAALAGLCCGVALAAGGSRVDEPATPVQTPEQQANERYNDGLAARDNAWRLEKKLAGAPQEKQERIEGKIRGAYESSIRHFQAAVALDNGHSRALAGLGYAFRQLGDYEQAMAAYDAALEANPDYAEAIEYRGEAYLGLGRINEAQNSYRVLQEKNPELAAELLGAMGSWIAARREAGDADAAELDGLARWVEDRGQVADVSSLRKSRSW